MALSAGAPTRGALSRSSGNRVCGRFNELGEQHWPTTKRLCEVEISHHATKLAAATGEEGAAERLEAAKADYELAYALYRSACEYYLHVLSHLF